MIALPAHADLVKETWLRNQEGFSSPISSALIKATKMSCVNDDGSLFNMETTHSVTNPSDYVVKANFQQFAGEKYEL